MKPYSSPTKYPKHLKTRQITLTIVIHDTTDTRLRHRLHAPAALHEAAQAHQAGGPGHRQQCPRAQARLQEARRRVRAAECRRQRQESRPLLNTARGRLNSHHQIQLDKFRQQ